MILAPSSDPEPSEPQPPAVAGPRTPTWPGADAHGQGEDGHC